MRIPLTWIVLLLLALPAGAQTSHRSMPTPNDASAPADRTQPAAAKAPPVDLVQFQKDADELAQLAQTIPPDIGKVQKGVLPRDLNERLKKIEKLSKKLRGQLQWF
jgi:hypothetical protein